MSDSPIDVFQVIVSSISDVLGVDPSEVTRESDLRTDFDGDSLDIAEVATLVKKRTKVRIPKSVMANMENVGDVVIFVETELSKTPA